jgi:hypothetical protein
MQSLVGEIAQAKARNEALEIAPVQHVELAKRDPARPDLLHTGLIFAPPGIREGRPVDLVAKGFKEPLCLPGDSRSPIHQGSEYVEEDRPDGGHDRCRGLILCPATRPVLSVKIMAKSLKNWLERRECAIPLLTEA